MRFLPSTEGFREASGFLLPSPSLRFHLEPRDERLLLIRILSLPAFLCDPFQPSINRPRKCFFSLLQLEINIDLNFQIGFFHPCNSFHPYSRV